MPDFYFMKIVSYINQENVLHFFYSQQQHHQHDKVFLIQASWKTILDWGGELKRNAGRKHFLDDWWFRDKTLQPKVKDSLKGLLT